MFFFLSKFNVKSAAQLLSGRSLPQGHQARAGLPGWLQGTRGRTVWGSEQSAPTWRVALSHGSPSVISWGKGTSAVSPAPHRFYPSTLWWWEVRARSRGGREQRVLPARWCLPPSPWAGRAGLSHRRPVDRLPQGPPRRGELGGRPGALEGEGGCGGRLRHHPAFLRGGHVLPLPPGLFQGGRHLPRPPRHLPHSGEGPGPGVRRSVRGQVLGRSMEFLADVLSPPHFGSLQFPPFPKTSNST